MKANRLRWILLFLLLIVASELPAQQSEADHKLLADLRDKAERGVAESQFELGNTFFFGNLGVAKDEAAGVVWLRKSAEQGYVNAQFCLGICYLNGDGVAKDYTEAMKWFRKAAEQNVPQFQSYLGLCYANGEVVTRDEVEAVKWFRKAAERNYAEAQSNLVGLLRKNVYQLR